MDDFEYLDSCYEKWSVKARSKRSREERIVVDVIDTVSAVEGDGLSGWWEGLVREGEAVKRCDGVLESFRAACLNRFAEMIEQSRFCHEIVSDALRDGAEEYRFSPEQEKLLNEFEREFSAKGPDAREALLGFLPKRRT